MSISFPLDFPSGYNFRTLKVGELNTSARNTSPFSQKEQIYIYDGDRWMVEISWPPLAEAQARDLIGFLASLRGALGTFNFANPFSIAPRGIATGTPLVKGAGQTGLIVDTDGWTSGVTGILKRGDYINIGTGFYVITKDANSDGGGNSTLDIWPNLRGTTADNAAITVNDASMLCRLATNGFSYTVGNDGTYDIAITALEAI